MQFNPLDDPAILLEPLIVSHHSAWIEHIPFAYSLIALLQPRRVVELGVHAGDSYCAFCQAVQYLKLPTQCTGIDTWLGDQHTGPYSQNVLEILQAHHQPRYAAFSKLLQTTFDDAVAQFDDESIDLLHIDGLHTYQAVKHDFETWRPKLSTHAIVLFHDTVDPDFGVIQFWAEVSSRYPHFHFEHGAGLGLLAVGHSIPHSIQPLLNATPDQAHRIQTFYARLGREISVRRYYSAVMHKAFAGQTLLNQQKHLAGKTISPQSQNLQNALIDPAGFMHNLVQDIKTLLM